MGIETAAAVAGIAGGTAATAGGIATIFGGSGGGGGRTPELPPELEEAQLANFKQLLDDSEVNIQQTRELIPYVEERIDVLQSQAQQATPDPEAIARLNELDQEIAQRFGTEIAKDVQAGIVTDEAKEQAKQLQNQVAAELEAQGKQIDDQLLTDIQSQVRDRLAPTSQDAQAISEVRDALVSQVRAEGDIIQRDPAVERQLEEQRNKMVSDLAARGIDPNSTQGRRAMQEYNQRATETRFSVSEQLKTAKTGRLSQLAQSTIGAVQAADQARTEALSQVLGTQDVAARRIQRLSQLGEAITAPVQAVIMAGEPERLRRAENLAQAQLALGASQQQRLAFAGGLAAQAQLTQLRAQLPEALRARILETRGAQQASFRRLAEQKFSKDTKKLLERGQVAGFAPRQEALGPAQRSNVPRDSVVVDLPGGGTAVVPKDKAGALLGQYNRINPGTGMYVGPQARIRRRT
jgi:hypothetical protein